MSEFEEARPIVGVWLERTEANDPNIGAQIAWITQLVQDAARSQSCTVLVASPDDIAPLLRVRLAEVDAQEGPDWTLHTPQSLRAPREENVATPSLPKPWIPRSVPWVGTLLFIIGVIVTPLLLVRATLRVLLRPLMDRLVIVRRLAADPAAAIQIVIPKLRRQYALRALADALEAWCFHAQEPARREAERLRRVEVQRQADAEAALALAQVIDPVASEFAQDLAMHIRVDGWLILSPSYAAGGHLTQPRAVLCLDSWPLTVPLAYGDADWSPGGPAFRWIGSSRHLLDQGDRVAAPTRRAANRIQSYFDLAPERIRLLTPPPRTLLTRFPPTRTDESRREAAALLRCELAQAQTYYLRDFPFEDVLYLAVWADGSPRENLDLLAQAMRRLIQRDLYPIKAFVASPAQARDEDLWRQVFEQGLHHDLVPMPPLSTRGFESLIHASALTVYLSPSDQGAAPQVLSQAVSLGAPCLLCDGPDTRALLESSDLGGAVFDPYDIEALAGLIKSSAPRRDELLKDQRPAVSRMGLDERRMAQECLDILGLVAGRLSA